MKRLRNFFRKLLVGLGLFRIEQAAPKVEVAREPLVEVAKKPIPKPARFAYGPNHFLVRDEHGKYTLEARSGFHGALHARPKEGLFSKRLDGQRGFDAVQYDASAPETKDEWDPTQAELDQIDALLKEANGAQRLEGHEA